MYALRKYVQATGDEPFLQDCGAEMLVETARLWLDLGFYSDGKGGQFCINAVTGQVFTVFIIVVAAAEAAIGLGIVIALYRNKETIWVDEIDLLKW